MAPNKNEKLIGYEEMLSEISNNGKLKSINHLRFLRKEKKELKERLLYLL